MIEIVQVVQEFSAAGGVERVALELARAFSALGVPNSVVAATVCETVPSTHVHCIAPWLSRIPTRGALRHLGRAVVVPLFTLAATAVLRRRRGGVVLSHGDSLVGDILVVHAINAESLAAKRRSGRLGWLFNPIHAWVALRDRLMIGGLRYRMFVAVSARVAAELKAHYRVPEARIRVIPNGIDTQQFRPDFGARLAVRRELGIPREAPLLMFAGHEFHRKGLAHVIGALHRLDPRFWLLVVGSDNEQPYRKLAGDAGERVVFAGARSDMAALYAAADAFVLPTSYETFSLVCMEAMATAVPVFATRVGGVEDYLADGVNGYAIAADAADIADKVGRAFADRDGFETMRSGARDTALRYGWDRVARRYLALVRDVSQPAGRPSERAPGPQLDAPAAS